MATYDYNEAVYGALCYIYGDDDNEISIKEKAGFYQRYSERHYLSLETRKVISYRWSQGVEDFYWDVINSLNECSLTEKLEAYKTICIIINDFSANRKERWDPANKIREDIGISVDEYKRYVNIR
jgi:hypothetical protein